MIIVDDRATKDILQYVLQDWFGECEGSRRNNPRWDESEFYSDEYYHRYLVRVEGLARAKDSFSMLKMAFDDETTERITQQTNDCLF